MCFITIFFLEYATVGYMAKRIQMRKQRFTAVQKMAAEKKIQLDGPPGTSEPLPPPRTSTLNRSMPQSRSSVIINYYVLRNNYYIFYILIVVIYLVINETVSIFYLNYIVVTYIRVSG